MNLADLIAERLGELPGPRSLVELGLGPDEVQSFRAWARAATPLHLESQPREFGLTFLACATAAARERAGDSGVWPHVREWFSAPNAARLLPGGQPSLDLRDAIERAARYHDLRHAFDRGEGENRWYRTVLLQCGFTRPALERLPEWLAGQRPWRAIELLLDDPALGSDSFAAIFERLRGVRLGWYDDVPDTPWLAGDLNRLAREAARTRLSLGTGAASQTPAAGVRLEEAPGGGLAFRVPLRLPDSVIGRGPPHVDVELGGQRGPRAHRQHDGSYTDMPDVHVRLAELPATGTLALRLLDPEKLALHEEDLTLFAGDEDIDFFAAAGGNQYRRVSDPWVDLAPARGAMLRVTDDLPLRGRFSAAAVLGAGSRWQRVTRDEMPAVEVPLGDDIVWTFLLDESKRWPGSIDVVGDRRPWAPGSALTWTLIPTPQRARIRAARLGRERLVVEAATGGVYRAMMPARATLPSSFALRLHIEDAGQRFVVACPAPAPAARHLFARGDDGWHALTIDGVASLARPARWFPGPSTNEDTPWLFEGGRPVLPLSDRDIVLAPRLSGYGAPLCVEGRRFNRDVPHVIVCSALDGARCLGTLEPNPARTQLRLSPAFPWRDVFDLTVLGDDGVPRRLTAADYTVTGDRLALAAGMMAAAVAATCRGEAVAAVFSGRLHRAIDAAPDVGACARWLFATHAPVALPAVRDALLRAAARQPLAAIALGFGEVTTSGREAPARPRRDEFLLGFWRECLEQALPAIEGALVADPGVADLLLDAALNPFAAPDVELPGNTVAHAVTRLADADPVVAARVLRAATRSRDRALVRVLRDARAELRATTTAPSLANMASVLGVDERFVLVHRQTAVGWAIDRAHPGDRQENTRRLLYLPEFRQAVAADAIGHLTKEEPDAGRRPGHR